MKQYLPSAVIESDGNSTSDSPSYQVVTITSASDISENVKKVLSVHNIKNIEDLRLKNSLYIRDTGGQVEFYSPSSWPINLYFCIESGF